MLVHATTSPALAAAPRRAEPSAASLRGAGTSGARHNWRRHGRRRRGTLRHTYPSCCLPCRLPRPAHASRCLALAVVQMEALQAGLDGTPVVLIQGPPGTGKTRTILNLLSVVMHAAQQGALELLTGTGGDFQQARRGWSSAAAAAG